ncbi:MAG: ABC transporter substrate-binding protein [Candidatus Aminicenantes bacterium]|nr:ABC transporter substrate-binding protein [Candidatus Aminicenantes bacterium]
MNPGRILPVLTTALAALAACRRAEPPPPLPDGQPLYAIGIFQYTDAPTLTEVRTGLLRALDEAGLKDGVNVRLDVRSAGGDVASAQRIAQEFAAARYDLVVPLSTQCLQAALIALPTTTPLVFASVANPYILGAGRTPTDHLSHVTGVVSTGPVRQMIAFIREVLPRARRVGTLWTPSEINSEYYLELAREAAAAAALDLESVPVTNAGEIPTAVQRVLNRKVDALFPISDNTLNSSFAVLGRAADEARLPLFGGFVLSTGLGACAAMGFNFTDMGYKAGRIVLRVKAGESPGRIPFQSMESVKLFLNVKAAERQGLVFSPDILRKADQVVSESRP